MNGKKSRNALSEDEKKLWQKVTENITRLHSNRAMAPFVRKPAYINRPSDNPSFNIQKPLNAPAAQLGESSFLLKDIDHNWQKRLRRGKVKPEGKIDLHGLSQDRAFDALTRYIEGAHRRGKRAILVVTGKGRQKSGHQKSGHQKLGHQKPGKGQISHADYAKGTGILRTNVPRWLSQASLAQYIVSFYSANAEHGGDGALYVILKRHQR